jgi:hypothetical protein
MFFELHQVTINPFDYAIHHFSDKEHQNIIIFISIKNIKIKTKTKRNETKQKKKTKKTTKIKKTKKTKKRKQNKKTKDSNIHIKRSSDYQIYKRNIPNL